ncbi:hypothetical protein [Microbulbifer sp. SAOS-129_SWC]|uniref:hypothetical protein n=1 Tax=Microbulbifer sp. SAOS-129_SWC TaxID=3145235 RepID=UPI003216FF94
MQNSVSLGRYVKKRNGVALGATGSMRNMLSRSLGAGEFAAFWHYWNPIWGFYLSRNVMRPLNAFLPNWLAVLLTFMVSGAIHDAAVSLAKWKAIFFFTPWFLLMGLVVIISKYLSLSYHTYPWTIRCAINLFFIAFTLWLTIFLENSYV